MRNRTCLCPLGLFAVAPCSAAFFVASPLELQVCDVVVGVEGTGVAAFAVQLCVLPCNEAVEVEDDVILSGEKCWYRISESGRRSGVAACAVTQKIAPVSLTCIRKRYIALNKNIL